MLANDSDGDNDSLTPVLVQAPSRGTLTLNADGSFTYTPAANVSGVDTFSYKANDGSVDSGPATVTITVTPVNDVPVASDTVLTAGNGAAASVTLAASDLDGDPLTYQVVAGPSHGVLTGTAPNLQYVAGTGYVGPDSFTFTARDGVADSNVATVQIQVRGSSRPPGGRPVAAHRRGHSGRDPAQRRRSRGRSADLQNRDAPSHGTLSGTAPNLTYTPDPDYEGEDRFTFLANDGLADSNLASVDMWVWGVNDPPVVSNLQVLVEPEGSVTGQLQSTDTEGDWVFYWITSNPLYGTVTFDPESGAFMYVAFPNSPGLDSFTYTVYDWQSQGNEATAEIITTAGGGVSP